MARGRRSKGGKARKPAKSRKPAKRAKAGSRKPAKRVAAKSKTKKARAKAPAKRGRVPAMGRVSTTSPRTDTSRSGDELATARPAPTNRPANGAGLALRSRAYRAVGSTGIPAAREVDLEHVASGEVIEDATDPAQEFVGRVLVDACRRAPFGRRRRRRGQIGLDEVQQFRMPHFGDGDAVAGVAVAQYRERDVAHPGGAQGRGRY